MRRGIDAYYCDNEWIHLSLTDFSDENVTGFIAASIEEANSDYDPEWYHVEASVEDCGDGEFILHVTVFFDKYLPYDFDKTYNSFTTVDYDAIITPGEENAFTECDGTCPE